jgi:hypothetical protein
MSNTNTTTSGMEAGVYALFGPGALVASAVGLAFVVALWFTSMLFLVRGFVDGASSGQVTADSGYETVLE